MQNPAFTSEFSDSAASYVSKKHDKKRHFSYISNQKTYTVINYRYKFLEAKLETVSIHVPKCSTSQESRCSIGSRRDWSYGWRIVLSSSWSSRLGFSTDPPTSRLSNAASENEISINVSKTASTSNSGFQRRIQQHRSLRAHSHWYPNAVFKR